MSELIIWPRWFYSDSQLSSAKSRNPTTLSGFWPTGLFHKVFLFPFIVSWNITLEDTNLQILSPQRFFSFHEMKEKTLFNSIQQRDFCSLLSCEVGGVFNFASSPYPKELPHNLRPMATFSPDAGSIGGQGGGSLTGDQSSQTLNSRLLVH